VVDHREGLGWLSVIWVVGTAGVYGGLYGFAVGDRALVELALAPTLLAVLGWVVIAVQRSWWWSQRSRRRRAWSAGTAEVRAASPPPQSGAEYGRCELSLAVTVPGMPVAQVLVRDPRVPVRSWPEVGDILPVSARVDDLRWVQVLWDEFHRPPPSASDRYDDDLLLGDDEFDIPLPRARREEEPNAEP